MDLDTLLPEALHDVERAGEPIKKSVAKEAILRRVRRRRRAGTALSVAAVAVAVGVMGWVNEAIINSPNLVADDEIGPFEPLPEPPADLRSQLPDEWFLPVDENLVLLYRNGDTYHAFSEGRGSNGEFSCPAPPPQPGPTGGSQACIAPTAWERIFDATDELDRVSANNSMVLPEIPEGAEVLWQSVPTSGAIGIESSGACDRIDRFVPEYTCVGGAPERVDARRIAIATGSGFVPRNWTVADGPESKSRLFASTRPMAPPGRGGNPGPAEAFVSVLPGSSGEIPDPLPRVLSPDRFRFDRKTIHSVATRSVKGGFMYDPGSTCYICRYVTITYWIGPEASRSTWAETRYIVESLRFE